MQREDVQQLCTNAVDEFKRNARTLRRDTEGVDHYVVYNACKRVLYLYPDVCCPCSTSLHNAHSNTFHYTKLAHNLAMAFQAIVLEESEMQNPTALCTRLLFEKGYLVEGHPGFVRRLFRRE